MHVHALVNVRRALSLGTKATVGISAFMALMIVAPILVRLSERAGMELFPRALAYICFSWMGLLFLMLTFGLMIDLFRIAISMTGWAVPWSVPAGIGFKQVYLAKVVLVLLIYGYGVFEANTIQVNHLVITSPKIPAQAKTIRIAQISDVHLGLIVRQHRLRKILARVEEAKPDLLVSTGDLVDGQLNNLTGVVRLLADFNPPLGKIAVTGNHEFYAGLKDALFFTEQAGFQVLRDKGISLGGINLIGVDDDYSTSFDQKHTRPEKELFAGLPKDRFTILLKHRPVVTAESLGLFDLQLSGHTHNGRIFPFNLITRLKFSYLTSQINVLESGLLYINRGSGTWGPPIRIFAPPEVTIIDLKHGAELGSFDIPGA